MLPRSRPGGRMAHGYIKELHRQAPFPQGQKRARSIHAGVVGGYARPSARCRTLDSVDVTNVDYGCLKGHRQCCGVVQEHTYKASQPFVH